MALQTARKILIGLDGSHEAMFAFEWFKQYFLRDRDDVHIFHCADPPPSTAVGKRLSAVSPVKSKARQSTAKEEDTTPHDPDDYHAFLKKLLSGHGFKSSIVYVHAAKPGEAMVKAAEDYKIDVIILSNKGKGQTKSCVGSVCHFVTHNAYIPTLVCYPGTSKKLVDSRRSTIL